MPNTASIISTVASEFSLMLADCPQQAYDFSIEIRPKGDEVTTFVTLLLEGDGLSCWVDGEKHGKPDASELEQDVYTAIRSLPIVCRTIREINLRADRNRYDADC